MKKLMLTLGLIAIIGGANAAFVGGGCDKAAKKDMQVDTVASLANMRDDARVVLVGNIIEQIKKDKYLFEDETGTIQIEIDREDWRGVDVSPTDTIKIFGELDKGIWKDEIDVSRVKKVAKAADTTVEVAK
jgi:uncharacterized protein (TIGR00156 family)